MLHLRLLDEHDSIEALTALIRRAYAPIGQRGINYTAVDQTLEETARRATAGVCLLACDDAEIIGTLALRGPRAASQCAYLTQPHVAYISQLAVAPERQGEGVMRALVEAAVSIAREDGFKELVGDIAEPMTLTLDWFCRNGFEPFDEIAWPGKTYRSVLIRMRLDGEPA